MFHLHDEEKNGWNIFPSHLLYMTTQITSESNLKFLGRIKILAPSMSKSVLILFMFCYWHRTQEPRKSCIVPPQFFFLYSKSDLNTFSSAIYKIFYRTPQLFYLKVCLPVCMGRMERMLQCSWIWWKKICVITDSVTAPDLLTSSFLKQEECVCFLPHLSSFLCLMVMVMADTWICTAL